MRVWFLCGFLFLASVPLSAAIENANEVRVIPRIVYFKGQGNYEQTDGKKGTHKIAVQEHSNADGSTLVKNSYERDDGYKIDWIYKVVPRETINIFDLFDPDVKNGFGHCHKRHVSSDCHLDATVVVDSLPWTVEQTTHANAVMMHRFGSRRLGDFTLTWNEYLFRVGAL